jgi:hypothetical protein
MAAFFMGDTGIEPVTPCMSSINSGFFIYFHLLSFIYTTLHNLLIYKEVEEDKDVI